MRAPDRPVLMKRRLRRRSFVEFFPPPESKTSAAAERRNRVWAGVLAAIVGTAAGVSGAAIFGKAGQAEAAYAAKLDLRDAPLAGALGRRSALIASMIEAGSQERLQSPNPGLAAPIGERPRLIIIFDDMGLDHAAFDEIMSLPGPVTLSFLPYAAEVRRMAEQAKDRGDEIMLHLPMEPSGAADPGPHSLKVGMRPEALFEELQWNLARFDGYVGVNNHMGSKFTRDEQAMKRVLAYVKDRGLFFVDSVTTGESAVPKAGAAVGTEVFARDVFLDAEPGRQAVRNQLALAERIAEQTGYAVVICHPRRETLDVIGPWLTSAPSRGYRLSTVSSLQEIKVAAATGP